MTRSPPEFGETAKALAREGRYENAEQTLRDGLRAHPDHPVLSYALGVLLLARGAFAEGFRHYEQRWSVPHGPRPPSLSIPRWTGEAVRSLLVLPEQGFGDQIMFARYVPQLIAQGTDVTLVCPPELARLFEPLGATIQAASGATALPTRDAWTYIGSLPHRFGSFPTRPYLPGREGGAGVGVMLEGKSLGALPGEVHERLAALGRDLRPAATGARDFADTAEIVRGLELVISVDTAVAHLAGAMGKPCWVLLPHRADWRWQRGRTDSLWYPSARLFRQPTAGDWGGVAAEVERELRAAAAAPAVRDR